CRVAGCPGGCPDWGWRPAAARRRSRRAAPAAALTIVDQTKILTKRVLLPHVAAGPVPASLSCATREASAACSASHHFRNRLFASDQAIGGRRRQAFTHPLLCLAPSLRPM